MSHTTTTKYALESVKRRLSQASGGRYSFELTEYKNTQQKIKCKCNKCGHEWDARLDSLIRGSGCRQCSRQAQRQKVLHTLDEVTQKLLEISQGRYTFELTSYNGMGQPIKCQCSVDPPHTFEAKVEQLIYKRTGCPYCYGHIKLTLEGAKQKLAEASNGRYTFELTEYKNTQQKIKCKCNKCGYEWESGFSSLVYLKRGCRKCGNNSHALTLDEVTQRLTKASQGRYTFELTDYKHLEQSIKCRCNTCGGEFSKRISYLLSGDGTFGCPRCSIKFMADSKRFTLDEANQRLINASANRYTFELNEYTGAFQKIKCKCNKCLYEWEATFHQLTKADASGCPKCPVPISSQELEIKSLLESYGLNVVTSTRALIIPKELDIYIPTHNLAIEFNGVYWHCEQQGKGKSYHLEKTLACEAKGIKLLHIFDNEWADKRSIWESIILGHCNKFQTRIHARKCTIKEISNKTAKQFCNENHLQGGINSKVNIGAYHESTLVAVMTFGKPRYNKNYEWELLRFCSLKFHRIRGIASKLLAYFKRGYEPTSIISYGNRRWCNLNKNVYNAIGFKLVGTSAPNYYYYKNNQLHTRVQFQKHKLRDKLEVFDESKTEYENMIDNGYDRIWDCGNLVYEWRY